MKLCACDRDAENEGTKVSGWSSALTVKLRGSSQSRDGGNVPVQVEQAEVNAIRVRERKDEDRKRFKCESMNVMRSAVRRECDGANVLEFICSEKSNCLYRRRCLSCHKLGVNWTSNAGLRFHRCYPYVEESRASLKKNTESLYHEKRFRVFRSLRVTPEEKAGNVARTVRLIQSIIRVLSNKTTKRISSLITPCSMYVNHRKCPTSSTKNEHEEGQSSQLTYHRYCSWGAGRRGFCCLPAHHQVLQ